MPFSRPSLPVVRRLIAPTLGLAVAATGLQLVAPPAAVAAPVSIRLLNINDFHGRIDANTTKFATTIEQERAEAGDANTLFLSAGDSIGASLFASSLDKDVPTIDVLNALELATSAVGNHEFDQGFADLDGRVADAAEFDYLGANVYAKGTTTPALQEYDTFEVAGVTVGVIGVVTATTPTIVSAAGVAALDFGDPVAAVNRVAGQLSDGDAANGEADVIVAEYHDGAGAGTPDNSTLAEEIAEPGAFADIVTKTSAEVDAIFTGHTHKQYAWEAPVPGQPGNTRPILQTGSYGEFIGEIDLTVDSETGEVTAYTQRNVGRATAADTSLPRVAEVKTIVDAALAEAAEVGNQPIGEITADITTSFNGGSYVDGKYTGGSRNDRTRESTMGKLVANALRDGIQDVAAADIGIVNPGGLRDEFYFAGSTATNPLNGDGVITFAEANAVLTFSNTIGVVSLTGADLVDVLEQQWPTGTRGYLQLGLSDNVNVVADPTAAAGSRIKSVRIDGEPIDPAATYKVSTFSFLGNGGDEFTAFRNGPMLDTGLLDLDLFRGYIAENSPIAPQFARQQVFVQDFPEDVAPGDTLGLTLGMGTTADPVFPIFEKTLNLTSLGSPENTEVVATGTPAGGGAVPLGTFPVTGGIADIDLTVPAELAGGSVALTAAPSGTTVTLDVAPVASSLKVTAPTVNPGLQGRITVKVEAPGITPRGTVAIENGATTLATAPVVNGVATVALGTDVLAPGAYRLTATYSGDGAALSVSTTFDLRVNKAAAQVVKKK